MRGEGKLGVRFLQSNEGKRGFIIPIDHFASSSLKLAFVLKLARPILQLQPQLQSFKGEHFQ